MSGRLLGMRRGAALAILCAPLMASAVERGDTEAAETVIEPSDTERAALWDLKPREWARYQALMEGPRGLWSPDLDPVWVLGIHAETDAERRRYAELAVRREKARVEAELAFQRAYDAAWDRLYPGMLLIDPAQLSYRHRPEGDAPGPGDRVLLFARDDCDRCGRWLGRLLDAVAGDPRWGLDIFLRGMESDQAIRAWAAQHGIPADRVRRRTITLNHDDGMLERLAGASDRQWPVLLLRRADGSVEPTTLSRLRVR